MKSSKNISTDIFLETDELVVKKSSFLKNQFGVFTKKSFKKGQKLFLVKGKIKPKPSIYSFSVGLSKHIEPVKENGDFDFGHYMNHSCNPNTMLKIMETPKKSLYIKVIALKNINKNKELTFDYSTLEYTTVTKSQCKCLAKNCRKYIYGFKNLPDNIVKKYQKKGMIPKYLLNIK